MPSPHTITTETLDPGTRAPGRSTAIGRATAMGRHRTVNEDAMLTGPGWFAIADGMGGHRAGDVASTLVVDVLSGYAALPPSTDPSTIDDVIARAVARANTIVHRAATGPRSGMGTTLVAAVVLDDGSAAIFHIGDSRCYHVRDGSMTLLTSDHTHVQELVDAGRLSADRSHHHPMRHVLTRAVGIDAEVTADVCRVAGPLGRLLLCSDGVSAHVDAVVMERIVTSIDDPQHAADELVAAAIEAGTRDDASVIVVDPTTRRPCDPEPHAA
jgi:protein phosphatase